LTDTNKGSVGCNVLGVIDGDLQHPPEVLTQLLGGIQQGADLAVASQNMEGGGVSSWSVVRRFLSRGAQVLGLIILPIPKATCLKNYISYTLIF